MLEAYVSCSRDYSIYLQKFTSWNIKEIFTGTDFFGLLNFYIDQGMKTILQDFLTVPI